MKYVLINPHREKITRDDKNGSNGGSVMYHLWRKPKIDSTNLLGIHTAEVITKSCNLQMIYEPSKNKDEVIYYFKRKVQDESK